MKRLKMTLLLLLIVATVSYARTVVIVHESIPSPQLSLKQVKRIFLARVKSLPNGRNIQLLDQRSTSKVYQDFYKFVAKKSPLKMTKYWVKLSFTGRAERPYIVKSNQEVIRSIRNNHRYIGYVDVQVIPDDMKVVYTLP